MSLSNQSIDWHLLNGDDEDTPNWPTSLGDDRQQTVGKMPHRDSPPSRLYELILAVAVIYGVAVFWVWQRAEVQLTTISEGLQETRSALFGIQREMGSAYPNVDNAMGSTEAESAISSLDTLRFHFVFDDYDINTPYKVVLNDLSGELLRYGLDEELEGREILPQWEPMIDNLYGYFSRNLDDDSSWRQNVHFRQRRALGQYRSLNMYFRSDPANPNSWTDIRHTAPYEIADPLVEFIIVAYGPQYIPDLLTAFENHQTWDALTLAVFDVSQSEFEERWHAYLREHYPRE